MPCPEEVKIAIAKRLQDFPDVERRVAERRIPSKSKAEGPNPKDVAGSTKAALLLFPPIAIVHASDAMMDGAGKYEPYNWRAKDILLTNYLHAALRHILAVWEGEEYAHDSHAKHLGHALATLGIVLDAAAHGCLIDDRPTSDGGKALRAALEEVATHELFRKTTRQVLANVARKPVNPFKVSGAQSGRTQGAAPNRAAMQKVKRGK